MGPSRTISESGDGRPSLDLREAGSDDGLEECDLLGSTCVFYKAWRPQEVQALTAFIDQVGPCKETFDSVDGRPWLRAWGGWQ